MLARTGHAADAVALVEPLLAQHATHPRVAAIAASAHAAAGNRTRALEIADAALRAHAREPILLAAKARIHLAASEWQPALDALRIATEVDPRDATLLTERGRAAKQLGQLDEARTAFSAAIELDPRAEEALRSLLAVQLETHDLDGARATLARIDTARITNVEIERLRGRFLVDTFAGHSGLEAMRRARRGAAARRDRELAYWLGRLQLQAEQWSDAINSFDDAMPAEGEPGRRDIQLWRVMACARAGREPQVEQVGEALRAEAETTPFERAEEARLLAAEAWSAMMEEQIPRALILARRAIALDRTSSDALLVLATGDELQHREPNQRLRNALEGTPPAIEAAGRLALMGDAMSPERCGWGRQYLRAAPRGQFAQAVQERVATCPPEPPAAAH
jgi:Flp pilus assembly protein TadD